MSKIDKFIRVLEIIGETALYATCGLAPIIGIIFLIRSYLDH